MRDETNHIDGWGIERRTLLRSAATASAIGFVGIPAISGSVAATSHGFENRFYTVHPYKGYEGGERYLVSFDPTPDDDGDIKALSSTTLSGSELSKIGGDVIGTVAFDPNGALYAVNAQSGALVNIAADGTVSHIGTNSDLQSVPASGILPDGTAAALYGVNKDQNSLVKINLGDATTMASPTLTVDSSFSSFSGYSAGAGLDDIYGSYHIGVAVDFENEELFGVIGNSDASNNQDDLIKIATDGTVTLVDKDVIDELSKIGVEFDPCTGSLYATRNGPDVWQVRTSGGTSTELGSVYVDTNDNDDFDSGDWPLNVASLGSPWPSTISCPCTVDLIAGQHTDVGSVTTDLDGDVVTVTIQTEDNWYLDETHLEVVCDPADFPTAGNDNPKVGQFTYGDTYGPGVQTDTFDVDMDCDTYYVAAHAVVYHTSCRDLETEDPFWASEVVDSNQGTTKSGGEVADDRDDPTAALQPGGVFYSLGFDDPETDATEGTLTVAFDHPIYNADGAWDILVHEVTNGRNSYPEEKADVSVLADGEWEKIGTISNQDNYDGSSPGVSAVSIPNDIISVEQVKLVDATDPSLHNGSADGFDVDGIAAQCLKDQEETAWGEGCAFTDKGSWAMYFEYDGEDCGCLSGGSDDSDSNGPGRGR